jgi:uncharacterized membrane protein YfcA
MFDIAPVDLVVFLAGTFAAAFVTGLAGFAFGMVAAAFWLHALTPVQTVALIVAYALLVQGHAVWKLRHKLRVRRVMPFIVGSVVGIPAGIAILQWASPAVLRLAVGIVLVLFSLYNLAQPKLPQAGGAGAMADGGVGVLNGVLGASTGLGGILPAIWCGLRGWPKDEQRAVFQPTAVATFVLVLAAMGGTQTITNDILRLFVIGLPALLMGTWLGWKLYGKLDEASFRKVVLWILLASGVALVLMAMR